MRSEVTGRTSPMRWRLHNSLNPRSYLLRRAGVEIVRAQESRDNTWFWYGLGINTAGRPLPTLDDIKKQVAEYLATDAARRALEDIT